MMLSRFFVYAHEWQGDRDKVGPHGDLLDEFPVPRPPHE